MTPGSGPNDFQDVLESLDAGGRGFEDLSAWFLLNDPEWKARVRRVWRWQDWPGRFGPDRGIDLVAETFDGNLIAVQAKHYAPGYSVTKADVDSFLSESSRAEFSERVLIATTLKLGGGAPAVIAAQEKPVTLILRDRLEEAQLDWRSYRSGQSSALPRSVPRPHQERALEEVVKRLGREQRGKLLMPCGTGKTLTALWVAERLEARLVLVLVPTLVLVRQMAQAWRAEMSGPFELLKVCSDRGADKDDELAHADLSLPELGSSVTTDPAIIAEFLGGAGRRVIVGTYKSSPQIAKALAALPGAELDLAICDEAHHCAGLEGRASQTILDDTRIPVKRRLFVTATPTIFAAGAKQAARKAEVAVASMDDSQQFGFTLHRLSFREAVEQELLCPFRVVVMPVKNEEVRDLIERRRLVKTMDGHVTDAYSLAAQIACLRTMQRYGCRRLVAFHPRVKQSRRFAADVLHAALLLDPEERPERFHAAHVDGYMNRAKREQALRRFVSDEDTPQLLSNVRLLAEGLDVPGIDAICLIDTERGPGAVVQALGRVVRTAAGKTEGTVLLPVLVGENQTVEEALRSSEHRPVLEVLAALRAIDTEIVNTVEGIRLELGPRPPSKSMPTNWVLDAPTEVGEEFAQAIEICLAELLNARRSRREPAGAPTRRAQAPSGLLPDPPDWTDSAVIEQGLEIAEQWQWSYSYRPIERELEVMGFPLGKWWPRMLRQWERGQLSDDFRRRCAHIFSWLSVPKDKYPRARAEMAALDNTSLARRLDDWLRAHWYHYEFDTKLVNLIRSDTIGSLGTLSTEQVLKRIPSELAPDQRASLALRLLQLGGEAAFAGGGDAARGFLEALDQPGRSHMLQVTARQPDEPPRGAVDCYAHGWEAGQKAVRLLPRQAEPPRTRSRKNGQRPTGTAKNAPGGKPSSPRRSRRRRRRPSGPPDDTR